LRLSFFKRLAKCSRWLNRFSLLFLIFQLRHCQPPHVCSKRRGCFSGFGRQYVAAALSSTSRYFKVLGADFLDGTSPPPAVTLRFSALPPVRPSLSRRYFRRTSCGVARRLWLSVSEFFLIGCFSPPDSFLLASPVAPLLFLSSSLVTYSGGA